MGADGEEHIKIPRWTTAESGIAFTTDTQARAGVHASGNVDPQFLANLTHTPSRTTGAGIGNDLACSPTGRTFGHLREIAEGGASGATHLACATAGAAGGRTTAGLRTTAIADVTGFEMRNLDLPFLAEDRLIEVNGEVVAEVIPLLGTTTPWTPASRTSGPAESLEKGFEEIRKPTHVTHIGCACSATQARFTKLVVTGSSLGIAEDFVGPTDFLEPILSTGLLVDIGVVLTGQAPIGAFQRIGISIATDTQQVVEISH